MLAVSLGKCLPAVVFLDAKIGFIFFAALPNHRISRSIFVVAGCSYALAKITFPFKTHKLFKLYIIIRRPKKKVEAANLIIWMCVCVCECMCAIWPKRRVMKRNVWLQNWRIENDTQSGALKHIYQWDETNPSTRKILIQMAKVQRCFLKWHKITDFLIL